MPLFVKGCDVLATQWPLYIKEVLGTILEQNEDEDMPFKEDLKKIS